MGGARAGGVGEGGGKLATRLLQDGRKGYGLLGRCLDLVEAHEVGHLLGEVDHVVEGGDELVSIRDREGRRRLDVEVVDHVVRDAVALRLELLHLETASRTVVRPVRDEVSQQRRRLVEVLARSFEERVEALEARGAGEQPPSAFSVFVIERLLQSP